MFERLYTTKMSADKKSLQKRFSKIRSKSGKISRLMAIFMSIAVLITITCATIVMAAVGSDGMEYWDKNEVFFLDGIKTTISLEGRSVPEWIYEDVTDTKSVDVTMRRYEYRQADGWLIPMNLIEFSGNKGKVVLASNSVSKSAPSQQDIDTNKHNSAEYLYLKADKKTLSYSFIEYYQQGLSQQRALFENFISPKSDKFRGAKVSIIIDDNWEIDNILIHPVVNDEYDNPLSESDKYDFIELPFEDFTEIGSFEKNTKESYIKLWDYTFSHYEKDYKNRNVDGIKINIDNASTEKITMNIACDYKNITRCEIEVFNQYTNFVSLTRSTKDLFGKIDISPRKEKTSNFIYERENNEAQFNSGETYRVTVRLCDDTNRIVYRWQEYITIP